MRDLTVKAALVALLAFAGCSKEPSQKASKGEIPTNAGALTSPTQASVHIPSPQIVVTKRHIPSDFVYRGTNVVVQVGPAELVIQKNRGPDTVEAFLDYALAGDFTAWMTVEFASPEELGVDLRGGTPVPYYGLRSASGSRECYFNLNTVHTKGKQYEIVLRREAGKVSALLQDEPQKGLGEMLPDTGYISFVMNDVSRVRLHHVRLESPPGKLLVEYGQSGSPHRPPTQR